MIPASFDESTEVLAAPASMTGDQCEPLCVWRGDNRDGFPCVVSCWKLEQYELDEINRTGRVWLILCGETMPPTLPLGFNPFKYGVLERTEGDT